MSLLIESKVAAGAGVVAAHAHHCVTNSVFAVPKKRWRVLPPPFIAICPAQEGAPKPEQPIAELTVTHCTSVGTLIAEIKFTGEGDQVCYC